MMLLHEKGPGRALPGRTLVRRGAALAVRGAGGAQRTSVQRWRKSGQCGGAWAPGAASASAGAARLTVGVITAAQADAVGAFTCGMVVPAAGASPGAQQQGAMVRARSCWHRFSCWQQRAADGVRGARLAPTLEAARRTAARAAIMRGARGRGMAALSRGGSGLSSCGPSLQRERDSSVSSTSGLEEAHLPAMAELLGAHCRFR